MRNLLRTLRTTLYLLCVFSSGSVFAAVNGTYELGPAVVNGDDYEIAVTVEFESDAAEEAVFFAVDLSATDEGLTNNGRNYSRFEFVKNLDLVEWQQLPGTGFGDEPLQQAVEYDTIVQPLSAGRYEIGRLVFDAEGLDASVFPATISIDAPGTTIGIQLPNDSASFDFIQLERNAATWLIPEPSSEFLLALGFLVWARSGNFRRRR